MWSLLKKFFFLFDAERAHYLSMDLLGLALRVPVLSSVLKSSFTFSKEGLSCTVDGIRYPNPVGLAAGFDKDGRWLRILEVLGFGSVEVGTVTPKPQPGNDKPRLFRLVKDLAIINRMGFNNDGADALASRLERFRKRKSTLVIGGNIGKNKSTGPELAAEDYLYCFKALFDHVDYFVVNVSSPNTPGLRALQEKEPLTRILRTLQTENLGRPVSRPIYLKIAPDLSPEVLSDILEVVQSTGIHGIVATNTTVSRPDSLVEKELSMESGGLSGAPLTRMSGDFLKKLRSQWKGTIISVGGIMDPEDAAERLSSGADLIQVYSGLIYRGPWLVRQILRELDGRS